MRVTFSIINQGIDAIGVAAEEFTRAQRQVQTGKRLQAPSDDPAAAERIINGYAEVGTLDSYTRATDSATSRLAVVDNVLTDLVDTITDAKATVASARGSNSTALTRDAAAVKLQDLRNAVQSAINTTFRGTYVFSGAESQTASYAQIAGVWTYQGDANAITVDIGRNRPVTSTFDGQSILKGSDTSDLLTTLDDLVTAAQANDQTALSNGFDALTRAFDRVTRAQNQVGSDLQATEEQSSRLTSYKLTAKTAISKDQDADLAAAISDMTKADTAYRAALQSVSTAGRLSLLDYLR